MLSKIDFFMLYLSIMKKNGEEQIMNYFLESDLCHFLENEKYKPLLASLDQKENIWGKYVDLTEEFRIAYLNKFLYLTQKKKFEISQITLKEEVLKEILTYYTEEEKILGQNLYEEMKSLREEKIKKLQKGHTRSKKESFFP